MTETPRRKAARNGQPEWASELTIKYQSNISHAFLLHGNVQDYVAGLAGQSLKGYLTDSFKGRDLVVNWDRANGFSLPSQKMRQKFVEIAGIPIPGGTSGATQNPARPGGLAAGLNRSAAPAGADLAAILGKIRNPSDALDALLQVLHWRPAKKSAQEEEEPFRVAVVLDCTST